MENWKKEKLKPLGWFRSAGVNKKIDSNQKEISLINYMDVYRNHQISSKIEFQKVTAKDAEIKNANVLIGDVLFTPSSEKPTDIGHAGVVMEKLKNTVYSYHLIRFRPFNPELFNPLFFSYLLNTYQTEKHFVTRATGTTRYTLSLSDFKSLEIEYPENPKEQTAIATILSKVDEAIEATRQSIKAAEKLKKALMQNLLTGKLKPDGTWRTDDEFYEDEKFGKVPVGWEVKAVNELIERKNDTIDPVKSKQIFDYVGLEHIAPNEFSRIGKGKSNETLAIKVMFKKGDLLYGKLRPYLNKVWLADITGVGSTEFLVFQKNNYVDWIYLNFQTKRFLDFTLSMTAGTQHPRASWRDVKRFLVIKPFENSELKLIYNKIISTEIDKKQKQTKIQILQRLKKSLMQKLLTGKVRVNPTIINDKLLMMNEKKLTINNSQLTINKEQTDG
jgi:type I restriction enzyme S subunit